jgi:hypothetical protein
MFNARVRALAWLSLTLASTLPTTAAAQPVIGPETATDAPVIGPLVAKSQLMRVASDGVNYLVVWDDTRGGSSDPAEVFAARVDPSGQVLDTPSLVLGTGSRSQLSPSVSFDGTNFVAAWTDSSGGQTLVRAARISRAGVLLDPGGIVIATPPAGTANLTGPSVTSSPTGVTLITWLGANPTTLQARRLSSAGLLLDVTPITLGGTPNTASYPQSAFDGTDFLVVFWDTPGSTARVAAQRIGTNGALVDAVPLTVENTNPAMFTYPGVGCGAGTCLVSWEKATPNYSNIVGARVAGGALLDATPFAVTTSAFSNSGFAAVAWGSGQYAVAFADNYNTDAVRLVSNAGVVAASGVTVGYGQRPAIAAGDGGFLATAPSTGKVSRIGATGVLLDPNGLVVGRAANAQLSPAVAFGGGLMLAVWTDTRGATPSVRGQRFSAAGLPLDATSFVIHQAPGANLNGLGAPAVTYDGVQFVVAWNDETYLMRAARVSTAGAVLDPTGLSLGLAFDRVATISSDGTNSWVFWVPNVSTSTLYGARVSHAGAVLDAPPLQVYSAASGTVRRLSSCFDGQSVWASWDWYDFASFSDRFLGARLTTSGANLDPGGRTLSVDASGRMGLASGPVCLAYWTTSGAIHATRLARSGGVLDSPAIVVSGSPTSVDRGLTATWSGSSWLVGWVDRSTPSAFTSRVSLLGTPLDPAPLTLAVPATSPVELAASSDGVGHARFIYERYEPSRALQQLRVFAVDVFEPDAGAFDAGGFDGGFVVDAGRPDAGVDAGSLDAGTDAGRPDAGLDAGLLDAGTDAGRPDAGLDAGLLDAGTDAGRPDAGLDAGLFDAGTDAGRPDAGLDAGSLDAGTDAGRPDAGFDAGSLDAGAGDAGPTDAGTTDAGGNDAGLADAGRLDAGIFDAGTPPTNDAGAGAQDAGEVDAGTGQPGNAGSCGCTTVDPGLGLALVVLGLTRRRRPRAEH